MVEMPPYSVYQHQESAIHISGHHEVVVARPTSEWSGSQTCTVYIAHS